MPKVFMIHGFEGSPNGGWRPWLMGELAQKDIYACALSMPHSEDPQPEEWVAEIVRHIVRNNSDQIYLVGHSLGVPAILKCVESLPEGKYIAGAVLVSGPSKPVDDDKVNRFLNTPFDFKTIKGRIGSCAIIQGDNDPLVSFDHAENLSKNLDAQIIVIKNGGHLNGSSGWLKLPEALDSLLGMIGSIS